MPTSSHGSSHGPPDEVLVAARDVPRRKVRQRNAVEPGGDALVERGEPLGERAESWEFRLRAVWRGRP